MASTGQKGNQHFLTEEDRARSKAWKDKLPQDAVVCSAIAGRRLCDILDHWKSKDLSNALGIFDTLLTGYNPNENPNIPHIAALPPRRSKTDAGIASVHPRHNSHFARGDSGVLAGSSMSVGVSPAPPTP